MVDFACLYARFDPAVALEADDPAYVDWQEEVGLTDVKQQLANCVRLTTTGYSHRLVTGLRGGGKTTELRRLKQALEDGPGKRYFVSFLDADDTLDLDDADPTDLVLAIVARLIADLRAAKIEVKAGNRLKSFLSAAQEILASVPDAGVDVALTDPLGIAKLSTTLKRQPSIRRRVRDLLEGRNLDTLYDAINEEVLPPVRDRLGRDGFAGVLVVVDQLDRIPPEDDRHRRLFWEGRGKLTALDCHVLYTAPIEYAFSRASQRLDQEYGEILGLPLLPVTAADPGLRDSAIALTRRIAARRIEGCGTTALELFEDPAALDELVELSGGHLRTLFLLVRTAIERSNLSAPLTRAHMTSVIEGLAAKYLDPLEGPEREVALRVHETKQKPDDQGDVDRFHDLLHDQYVLTYWAGDRRWYDWNPLLGRSKLGASAP